MKPPSPTVARGTAFGSRLSEAIAMAGMQQRALAQKAGIRPEQVSKWVSGRSGITQENAVKVAAALEVGYDALIYGPPRAQQLDRIERMIRALVDRFELDSAALLADFEQEITEDGQHDAELGDSTW
ncbi:MAG: helix-turn-helix transcriptional regulator [Chloroflexi bacterium]|nr:helix-turn-helix transcriptional regulator [Chloroflexota bacterium]